MGIFKKVKQGRDKKAMSPRRSIAMSGSLNTKVIRKKDAKA